MPRRTWICPPVLLLAGCISDKLHQETLDMIDALEGDTGCADPSLYKDTDGDGYGDPAQAASPCDDPAIADDPAWVADSSDCDDSDGAINPSAADDTCDEIDNDCDDSVDEDGGTNEFFLDSDGDEYGDPDSGELFCAETAPVGYIDNNDDCDDNDDTVYPGAPETCDGQLNNCNSKIGVPTPSGNINLASYLLDAAADGLGWVVTGVGDWNGDGLAEIAASAPQEGADSAGLVSIWASPVSPGDSVSTNLGVSGGQAGYSLSGGEGALLVGAPLSLDGEGEAYLFTDGVTTSPSVTISGGGSSYSTLGGAVTLASGLTANGSLDLIVAHHYDIANIWYVYALPDSSMAIDNVEDVAILIGAYFGDADTSPVVFSGDIDGDGNSDLAVGGEGTVKVYLGPITESPTGPSIEFNGANTGSEAGTSMAMLEQSGTFAIGAPGDGKVYLISAPSNADTPYDIDNDASTTLSGAEGTGSSLAVGDFNRDGEEDLLVGASLSNTVYLLYGPIPSGEVDLAKAAGAVFSGAEGAGWSVAVAEEASAPGCSDIVIGAPTGGVVYFVPGGETLGESAP